MILLYQNYSTHLHIFNFFYNLHNITFHHYKNFIFIFNFFLKHVLISKHVLKKNIFIYNYIILKRIFINSNLFILLGFFFKKNIFYWILFSFIPFKSFLKHRVKLFSYFNLQKNKFDLVKNLIFFKKKIGFLKRKKNFHYFVLTRLLKFKRLKKFGFSFNNSDKFLLFKDNFLNKNALIDDKKLLKYNNMLDFKNNWFTIFRENRFIFSNFLFFKKTKQIRQTVLTRFFSKFIKKNFRINSLILLFESFLINLLIKSKLILSLNDSIFLIESGIVYLNGRRLDNIFSVISVGDVVSLKFLKMYFNFFKFNLNFHLKLTFSLGKKLWLFNRFKNNLYKQSPASISDIVLTSIYFYDDIPSFLEVDYSILSFFFVKKPVHLHNYNYFFLKFINFFMIRLYNWKYVV